jgi:hypothetical protein
MYIAFSSGTPLAWQSSYSVFVCVAFAVVADAGVFEPLRYPMRLFLGRKERKAAHERKSTTISPLTDELKPTAVVYDGIIDFMDDISRSTRSEDMEKLSTDEQFTSAIIGDDFTDGFIDVSDKSRTVSSDGFIEIVEWEPTEPSDKLHMGTFHQAKSDDFFLEEVSLGSDDSVVVVKAAFEHPATVGLPEESSLHEGELLEASMDSDDLRCSGFSLGATTAHEAQRNENHESERMARMSGYENLMRGYNISGDDESFSRQPTHQSFEGQRTLGRSLRSNVSCDGREGETRIFLF